VLEGYASFKPRKDPSFQMLVVRRRVSHPPEPDRIFSSPPHFGNSPIPQPLAVFCLVCFTLKWPSFPAGLLLSQVGRLVPTTFLSLSSSSLCSESTLLLFPLFLQWERCIRFHFFEIVDTSYKRTRVFDLFSSA